MKLTSELKEELRNQGYYEITEIPKRGICGMRTFMYTHAIVYGIDESGYVGRYCYSNALEALIALKAWDGIGDPIGSWIKHKGKYEYSNPKLKNEYDT